VDEGRGRWDKNDGSFLVIAAIINTASINPLLHTVRISDLDLLLSIF